MNLRKKTLVLLLAGTAISATAAPGVTGQYQYLQNAKGLTPQGVTGTVPSAPVPSPSTQPSPLLSTNAVEFGSVSVGTNSSPAGVLLSNRAGAPLALSSIQTTGAFITTHNCPSSLAVGSSCTANAVFSPLERGAATGQLTFGTNAGALTVALTGTGLQAVAALSNQTLDLGNVALGATDSSSALVLTNDGNAPLLLTSLTASGAFTAQSDCGALPQSLAPKQTCAIRITFAPSTVGPAVSDLSVITDIGTKTAKLTGTGYKSDANFADVALLMSGDGTAGSTAISDSSSNRLAIAATGNAQVTASPVKMGTGAVVFDGAGDILTTGSPNFAFGTLDFTIEFWMYSRAHSGSIAGGQLFGTVNGATSGYSINLGESPDRFRVISNARGNWADDLVVSAGGGCPVNTWCHMAVVRQGDNLYIFKNGTKVASRTGVLNYNYSGTTGVMGRFSDGPNVRDYNGLIDDLRVTRGVARYTTNFAVPDSAYPTK